MAERQASGYPTGPSSGTFPRSTAALLSEAQERLRLKQHQKQLARRAKATNNFQGWRDPQNFHLPVVSPSLPSILSRQLWSLQDFEQEKKLYQGHVSSVYQARDTRSGQSVCLKVYSKANLTLLNAHQVLREIRIHSQVQHTNIIQFYAAWEDDARYFIVTEFARGGDLFTDLQRKGGELPERTAIVSVIQPILSVLMYLNNLGVLHRDLKPENMLYVTHGSEKHIKVADFGLAINCNEERPITRAGTLDYMAPEVLVCETKHEPEDNKDLTSPAYDAQVDVWGLGVVAYELLVGATPFEDDERVETIQGILQSEPDIPEFLSQDARDFIRVTLAKNPRDRPTVKQLMAHPWVQEHAEPRSAIYCQGEIHRMLDRGGDLNNRFKEGLSWKGNGQRISAASFLAQGTQLRFGEEVPIPPPQPLHMHPSLESSVLSMCPHGDSAAAGVADDRGHYIEQASVCGKSWNQGDYQDRDSANGCMGVQQSMAKQALGHTQVPEENYGPPLVSPAVPQQSLDDGAMPMDLDEHPSLESLLMRQQH